MTIKPPHKSDEDARLEFIFDELFEAIRFATGAMVAIGTRDDELAHSALANYVRATRLAVRSWDAHCAARNSDKSGEAA
jgi:hypothetical protein